MHVTTEAQRHGAFVEGVQKGGKLDGQSLWRKTNCSKYKQMISLWDLVSW
jgi:hypothetical protein